MNIEKNIGLSIIEVVKDIYKKELDESKIILQPTKKEFEGEFTFVTFPFTRELGKAPQIIAEEIGKGLVEKSSLIAGYNVVKGFLNLELTTKVWLEVLNEVLVSSDYGTGAKKEEKVMVEYSSPNTNKPLHLGHLRNNFLGFSVAEILEKNGYEVIKANLINDRGIHICKSMIAYQRFGNGETPEQAGVKGDHLIGKYYVAFDKAYKEEIEKLVAEGKAEEEAKKEAPIMKEAQQMLVKWEQNDPQVRKLWEQMNGWVYEGFNDTYKNIGVSFDKFYYESDTYLLGKDLVDEGLDREVFYRKGDHSVWCDLSDQKLDEKLVLRGDGTSVYITQDMGTADLKYKDFGAKKSIYVVGDEQDYHFKVLKLILQKLEKPYADGIFHLSYGMVDLPSGKMKSREGTVVDADDLVQEMIDTAKARTQELGKIEGFTEAEAQELYHTLAMGALKYYLLKVDPKKRMLFNPEESIDFQGNTGPFIQYTFARISALLRKADQEGIAYTGVVSESLTPTEKAICTTLQQYEKAVQDAGEQYAPSIIANYVYELAKLFNRFYAEVPIFKETDKTKLAFLLGLAAATGKVIENGMSLLGIKVPQRM